MIPGLANNRPLASDYSSVTHLSSVPDLSLTNSDNLHKLRSFKVTTPSYFITS